MFRNKKTDKNNSKSKEYFIKNSEGFLFTHLFASGSIQDNISNILGNDAEFKPISLKIEKEESIKDKGKKVVLLTKFKNLPHGRSVTIFPLKELKKISKKINKDSKDLLIEIFQAIKSGLELVFKDKCTEIENVAKLVDLNSFPVKDDIYVPVINYSLSSSQITIIVEQYISTGLLLELCKLYSIDPMNYDFEEGFRSEEKILDLFRDINKSFQKRLVENIGSSVEYKIELTDDSEQSNNDFALNLEELRLAPSQTIRILNDELTRRNFPVRSFAKALTGLSDDLKTKFFDNMSKNRKADLKDRIRGMEISKDEIITAQKELAWALIELTEQNKLKLSVRFTKQLKKIIEAFDKILFERAKLFLKSGKFNNGIVNVNDVIIQLIIRKSGRKVLIPAISKAENESKVKIKNNMTPGSWDILMEDIGHWESKVEDENDIITEAAAAQNLLLDISALTKKEFKSTAF